MYKTKYARGSIKSLLVSLLAIGLGTLPTILANVANAQPSVIRKITQSTERLELTVNSSRILTLEKPIPRMVVNNPEMVTVTALGTNQVQIAARKTGVTQINFWDEDDNVYSVDIAIYGDVRELELALKRIFPHSSVKVVKLSNSLVLEGFVEKPETVSPIIRLAEDYAPKIVNNITVGGVQQVLLKVKVMEVSRTKLRKLGFDFSQRSGSDFITSSVSGLLSAAGNSGVASNGAATIEFGIVDGNNAFFGFLEALQQNNLAKILADPAIVAVSGRPAHFNVGGEIPIVVPSSFGQNTIQYKPFGTQVDFVPIVLGNGNIRLEVKPRVSELDDTRSVVVNSFVVPGLRVREVDTAVEMKAGQTLALAGLIQTRVDSQTRGIPYLADMPYVGTAFRSVQEEVNEIELLIMVTPEFVDGLDPHEVPPCGPGMESMSPSDCQLYFNGHIEMPACGPCGPNCQGSCGNGYDYNYGPNSNGMAPQEMATQGMSVMATDEANGIPILPPQQYPSSSPTPQNGDSVLPPASDGSGSRLLPDPQSGPVTPLSLRRSDRHVPGNRVQMDNGVNPQYQAAYQNLPKSTTSTPGLIGPIGYDIEK